MGKRAILLAGGKGTRLYPYTLTMPKPLVPVGEYPIIEIIIRQLAKAGFDHITITVNHMADMIRAFCGDGSKWGITIDYSLETKPLSTMGPLKLIKDLPEDFLVMNGDVMTDLDFAQLYADHVSQGNIFTISAYERDHKVDYGPVYPDHEGHASDPAAYIRILRSILCVRGIIRQIHGSDPRICHQLCRILCGDLPLRSPEHRQRPV